MKNITMDINLTLKGPLLTQSTNPGELCLDKVIARHNNKEKTPYLPGTLIMGKLRQALEEIQSIVQQDGSYRGHWFKPEINHWLGKVSDNFLPNRKQLFLSDFDLMDESKLNHDMVRERISISEKSGAVETQQIVMSENQFTSSENYTFKGKLHFFAPADDTDNIIKHIKTGFNWFTQLGSMKSVGYGQVVNVDFTELQQNIIKPPLFNPSTVAAKIGLIIKPLYPFCLAGKPKADNLFESEVIISGSAIIGSIASTWSHLCGQHDGKITNDHQRKELYDNFSKLRISHAFPVSEDALINKKRPVVAPLSLCKAGDDKLYDVARVSRPCLINNEPPDFSPDWKDNKETLKEYPWPFLRMKDWGWASLNSELRVRTAIDRYDYRSKKGELFAYEQIIPDGKKWYAELDLSRIDEDKRSGVLSQLKSLLEFGFMGLGKTKTPVTIEFDTEEGLIPVFKSMVQAKSDNLWLITLQTDGLLGSPEFLDEAGGKSELEAMYKNYWERELSDRTLTLVRYFARQKLSGGRYRKSVFQEGNQSYRPWLLTEAGSVFVLQAADGKVDKAQEIISQWLNHGLPLGKSVCDYYGISDIEDEQWQNCPFIAQNGYGEIAVNIDMGEKVTSLNDDDKQTVSLINNVSEIREG